MQADKRIIESQLSSKRLWVGDLPCKKRQVIVSAEQKRTVPSTSKRLREARTPKKEAPSDAPLWATVNKESGGGKRAARVAERQQTVLPPAKEARRLGRQSHSTRVRAGKKAARHSGKVMKQSRFFVEARRKHVWPSE